MNEIQAIPTKYNGYQFRSRLEARWAVFFDALNIRYDYEHQGFDLAGTVMHSGERLPCEWLGPDDLWYLPDFYLPDYGCYVEIKPEPCVDGPPVRKAVALSMHKDIIVIFGTPGVGSYGVLAFQPFEAGEIYHLALGRKCDRLWLVNDSHQGPLNCKKCDSPKCGDKPTNAHAGLDRAYLDAREESFSKSK